MSELRTMKLNGKQYDCFVDSVARSYLGASAIVGSASGENIVVSDASNYDVMGLRIFGKTTQDGTPTPDAPVELDSAGDNGSITVNVTGEHNSQNVVVATPNGLPGIPVASGGNYTDANGQQWICDEIDFARGVYVRRVNTLTTQRAIRSYDNYAGTNRVVVVCDDAYYTEGKNIGVIMCDFLPTLSANDQYSINESCIAVAYNNVAITIKDVLTEDDVTQWLIDNPIKIQYALATPIETPLSEEELAAYASLHTYRNNTTVSNDAGAYMELEYMMDAKKYIDSKIAGAILTATVE